MSSLPEVLVHQPRSECRGLAVTTEGADCRAAAPSGWGELLLQVGRSGCHSRVGVRETAVAVTCRNLNGGEINSE